MDQDTRLLVGSLFFVVPVILLVVMFFLNRSRGGIGRNWGAVLMVILCWVVGMLLVMKKLDQFL
ncbi:hypothetical protein QLQ15_07710 [Lysobacter sp. LF1]|uniref:Uncharacterized protein n=1 Tax=Lysobacter stagni TaxID=3045172 RepID=A0ABT6XF83_9GAMM|nr:hypothetical protein [Lysobacter sp. LF1]MDI9238800.1 hypothetical protein [Lysobacter sp. LF1]